MIANVSAHRRANAFAQALEERQVPQDGTAERTEAPADEQGRLLTLAGALGELPGPELDPEVRVVQRAQLVAAMEALIAEGAGPDGPIVPEQRAGRGAHRASRLRKLRPRSRWSKGLAAGGLTVGVAAGAFSGVAAASSDALPGDSLYGLKRGMEDMKLSLADDNADRGKLYLGQASTRMNEARRLMERSRSGDLDPESLGEVRRALSGMHHDASEGHRLLSAAYARDGSLAPMQLLQTFSTSHRQNWLDLRDRLPAPLKDVRDSVNLVFDAINQEVDSLRSLLPSITPGREGGSPSDTSGESTGATGSEGTSRHPAPSRTSPSQRRSESGTSTPRPSESGALDERLIGGAGDLLRPPTTNPTPSSGTPGTSSAKPKITLPPLLPGLLPGLSIGEQDANK
ncbi:DUF5667 domain-containing protein [Streptomyces pathocidini]|uniref:DUF5667 domain-containing protein n=1 Tax=Streptomyces pathocidini TaxID=1650571 RepID=UPI0033EC0590